MRSGLENTGNSTQLTVSVKAMANAVITVANLILFTKLQPCGQAKLQAEHRIEEGTVFSEHGRLGVAFLPKLYYNVLFLPRLLLRTRASRVGAGSVREEPGKGFRAQ